MRINSVMFVLTTPAECIEATLLVDSFTAFQNLVLEYLLIISLIP